MRGTWVTSWERGIHPERTNRAPKRRSENDDSGWSILSTPASSSDSNEINSFSGSFSHFRGEAIHGHCSKTFRNGAS